MFIMWYEICYDLDKIKNNKKQIIINDKKINIDYTKYIDNIFYYHLFD